MTPQKSLKSECSDTCSLLGSCLVQHLESKIIFSHKNDEFSSLKKEPGEFLGPKPDDLDWSRGSEVRPCDRCRGLGIEPCHSEMRAPPERIYLVTKDLAKATWGSCRYIFQAWSRDQQTFSVKGQRRNTLVFAGFRSLTAPHTCCCRL